MRHPKNCKICGAPFIPVMRQIYCKSCAPYKPKSTHCLFCGRKLSKKWHFCNESCQLMHMLIYRKILSLPISEPTKSEVLELWRYGEVHDILDKLATYELQHIGVIKN